MDKIYTICLSCGKVQVRTDVIVDLKNKMYAFPKEKVMCPKCRNDTQTMATKDVKKLKKVLTSSPNELERKLGENIG